MNANKIYFRNLDGLRFLAFLSVFLAHSFYSENSDIVSSFVIRVLRTLAEKGVLGVNFFFVLSGFLITYLLETEQSARGHINIKKFYIRRVLRIWPLFYLIVFIGFIIVPIMMSFVGEARPEVANPLYYLFFINNYDIAPSSAVLGVLWSIAIEEQFYLFWPLLMSFFGHRNKNVLFFTIVLISFLWRYFGYSGYTDTITCINDMAVGGWMAYLVIKHERIKRYIEKWSKWSIVLIYISGIIFIYLSGWWVDLGQLAKAMNRFILSLFFLFIILEQNYAKNSLFKMSKSRFLTKWGTYTYGLYMFHFISIYLIGKIIRWIIPTSITHVIFTETILTFVFSLVLAYISFHLFEKPFLKLKNKFGSF